MIAKDTVVRLRGYLPEYLSEKGIRKLSRHFRCLSPTHEDRHPSMSYYASGQCVICFSCGFKADIFDLYAMDNGLDARKDFRQILDELSLKYNEKGSGKPAKPAQGTQAVIRKSAPYLESRGLTEAIRRRYGIEEYERYRMDGREVGPCVKLPYGTQTDYCIIRKTGEKCYLKPKGREEPIFFAEYLTGAEPVIIVESAICAYSVMDCGFSAIALNGTGFQRLVAYLKENQLRPKLVLCLDMDEAGRKASEGLGADLRMLSISASEVVGLDGCKDPNELYCKSGGRERLVEILTEAIHRLPQEESSLMDYILRQYMTDRFQYEDEHLSSGISVLDEQLGGIRRGLYLIGGIPSVGKTTLAIQWMSAFAQQGREVLYFSYEIEKKELVDKCLARESVLSDVIFEVEDIADLEPEELLSAMRNFEPMARKMHIYTDAMDITSIEQEIMRFERPIVFIDYLQTVYELGHTAKESIDAIVRRLSALCRERQLTMFVVSSLNRSSYWTIPSMDSFKESGSIEYSADVCLLLSYSIVAKDPVFLSDMKYAEKRKKLEAEKRKDIRQVDLVCVKNRFGNGAFTIPLQYDVLHHLFAAKK